MGKLGISADLRTVRAICEDRLSGAGYQDIGHISLGFQVSEDLSQDLAPLIHDAGLTVSIHPVDINFSDQMDATALSVVQRMVDRYDAVYVEEDLGLWRYNRIFLASHLLNPVLDQATLERTVENLTQARELFGCDILIENPPVYWSDGDMEFWQYHGQLCEAAGCGFALDIGHFIGYCRSLDRRVYLPPPGHPIWHAVRTIHISGMKKWTWNGIPVWLDQHTDPFDAQLLACAGRCIERAPGLYCVLLEMEGASTEISNQNLASVRQLVAAQGITA